MRKYRVRFDGSLHFPEYYIGFGFIGFWEDFGYGYTYEGSAWERIDRDKEEKGSKCIIYEKDRKELEK